MEHPMMQCPERAIPEADAREILEAGEYCVIATVDEAGAPYCTPLSYVMDGNDLYIHTGAAKSEKIRCWERDGRVCLTVAVDMEPCFEETFFTTRYASVIARGRIERVADTAKVRRVLAKLCMKYCPEFKAEIGGGIEREIDVTTAWVIHLDEISGKAGRRKPNGRGCVRKG